VVALPGVPGCDPVRDPTATDAWTSSFQNIQCYDTLKVQAVLNEIDGKTHDGKAPAPVPNVFGMNFQAVSVGQKLVEKTLGKTGGYLDALGTPSAALLGEIQFVDGAIGQMVAELKKRGLFESTLIIVSAKHGQSPIDPQRRLRIPADNPADASPGEILGSLAAQATEDDISLLWLTDQSQTPGAISTLEANATTAAIGEIFGGRALSLMFNDPLTDSRTPDIIVMPNVGVIYTGGQEEDLRTRRLCARRHERHVARGKSAARARDRPGSGRDHPDRADDCPRPRAGRRQPAGRGDGGHAASPRAELSLRVTEWGDGAGGGGEPAGSPSG